jgi:hypothetical protein
MIELASIVYILSSSPTCPSGANCIFLASAGGMEYPAFAANRICVENNGDHVSWIAMRWVAPGEIEVTLGPDVKKCPKAVS